ncbi:MAG: hypothetical protein CMO44_16950 [Verrucomicrobiales bacterium]|nr:hypothetical protein [Verrucomicrobiales bacterium]
MYVGKRSHLYDWCTATVKEYAERIGADYICQRQPLLRIKPDIFATNRSKESYEKHGGYLPIYEKENAFGYFDKYDQIAIIDSDIFIRDTAPDIFFELDDDQDFGGVVEASMPMFGWYRDKIINYSRMQYGSLKIDWDFDTQSGFPFMNMGMMLMNKSFAKYLNGQTPKEFIERKEFKMFVDGMGPWKWSTDQTLLNYWIRNEQMNIKKLDWKWNALYSACTRIKEAHFVHFFLKDKLPNKGEDIKPLQEAIL